ncbi:MAG: hypothetical protein R3C19_16170 [Planctomycetaceae bacterium]
MRTTIPGYLCPSDNTLFVGSEKPTNYAGIGGNDKNSHSHFADIRAVRDDEPSSGTSMRDVVDGTSVTRPWLVKFIAKRAV